MRDDKIKQIFKKRQGPLLGLRAFLLLGLAITLMVCSQRAPYFIKIRSALSVVVIPIQYMVNTPIRVMDWMGSGIATQKKLLDDNARLRAHELLLEAKLQKLLLLERENAQLRELLKTTSQVSGKVVVSQLMAIDEDPSLQRVVLDKGLNQGVYVGQPVIDAYGIIGQIVQVGPLTSQLMLISDMKSAVPVEDYRNGIRAIAVGQGSSGKLKLIDIPDTSDIQKGDLFVTSGLGLHYPVGYPLGLVTSIDTSPSERFASVTLKPMAHFDQARQVLLVWPRQVSLDKMVEEQLQENLPISVKQQNK